MPKLPLEGIRVVELGTAWTGPGTAMILGDFGAEVVKVEEVNHWPPIGRGTQARPSKEMIISQIPYTGGYPNREPGKHPWNVWPVFVGQARNKFSMTVSDLREKSSREIFLKLIEVSDIFIENNQPETLTKLGIDYEVLKKIKQDLIVVRLSAGGQTGLYSRLRTHGPNLDALGGHMSLRGYADMGPDATTECPLTDYTSPAFGVLAAMMALFYRHKTGKGQVIDCSQFETLPLCLSEAMMDCLMNQRVHTRIGNRDIHGAAPCGCYHCLGVDNWVNITVTSEREWIGLKRALGYPAWAEEERFSNIQSRWKNQDDLDKHVNEWTTQKDKYVIMHLLQKEGVPSGPVMNAADSYNDPHLASRQFFIQVAHEDAGTHLYPGVAWKLSETPLTIRKPPVRFGEDNEYVYKQILRYSDEEYNKLVRQGEISNEPSPNIL